MLVFTVLKALSSFGIGFGAGAAVGFVVKAAVPATVGPLTKIAVNASVIVIGAAVADLTSKYVDEQVDAVTAIVKQIKTVSKNVKEGNVVLIVSEETDKSSE